MTRWRLMTVGGMLVALMLVTLGGAARVFARSPGLVINEVYAPRGSGPAQQWFELHNMRTTAGDRYLLNGLVLSTSTVNVTLQTTMTLAPGGYLVAAFDPASIRQTYPTLARAPILDVAALGGLNPDADELVFSTGDGLLIDQVNWGVPDPAWPAYTSAWKPGLAPLSGTSQSWGHTGAADRDTDSPADWTIHETLSPGSRVGPPPQTRDLFLGSWSDWAGVLSGLLLWLAFIIIGIIAYRFERLRETRTYWQLLLLAPSGILFYTYIVAQGFALGAALTDEQKWLSFPILAASAVACLLAIWIFQNVARGLLEGE